MMIYALCRKIDFVENLRVFGVKIWTEISIRVKKLTFSMSDIRGGYTFQNLTAAHWPPQNLLVGTIW